MKDTRKYEAPRISIITPIFNAASTLEACIESVINQNYLNLEHWFIDGLSTDGSLEIIKKYAEVNSHIKYISEKDKGIYDAMNKGIDLAEGEWVYFLGGDDELCFDIFNSISEALIINKKCIVYGNVKINDYIYNGHFDKIKLSKSNICHQSIFTHKFVFDEIGKFNYVEFKVLADWEFNIKCWVNGICFFYIDKIIAIYSDKGFSNTIAVEGGLSIIETFKCRIYFFQNSDKKDKMVLKDILVHAVKDLYTSMKFKPLITLKIIYHLFLYNFFLLLRLNILAFYSVIINFTENLFNNDNS